VDVEKSSIAAVTIEELQITFATFELPEVLVSDNRSTFCSDELKCF